MDGLSTTTKQSYAFGQLLFRSITCIGPAAAFFPIPPTRYAGYQPQLSYAEPIRAISQYIKYQSPFIALARITMVDTGYLYAAFAIFLSVSVPSSLSC